MVPLSQLKPAEWNPRLIRDQRFKELCRSLQADPDFLWDRPVLASADGTIFGGNMRWRAAQQLGWTEIPARILDIPEQLAKERALRDNNPWGEWVDQDLAELVGELRLAESDLETLGFDADRLNELLEMTGVNGETEAPEPPEPRTVRCPECGHEFTPGRDA